MRLVAAVVGVTRWMEPEAAKAALVPASIRRRTSPITRAMVEVVGRLVERGQLDLSQVSIVHGSALGEIDVTVGLLEALARREPLSPTKFHNSVHNTAAGYLSIATANRGRSISIAAGSDTVAMVLLTAMSWLASGDREVVAVVAESGLPDALVGKAGGYSGLAVALHLQAGTGPRRLIGPARGPGQLGAVPAAIAGNPCAVAWSLASRIASGHGGSIALGTGLRPWSITLELDVA